MNIWSLYLPQRLERWKVLSPCFELLLLLLITFCKVRFCLDTDADVRLRSRSLIMLLRTSTFVAFYTTNWVRFDWYWSRAHCYG